jgi:hypothetical protein
MAHRLTAIDPDTKTANCEECGPAVGIRFHRPARRPNGSWRCRRATRGSAGRKRKQWLRQTYRVSVEQYDVMSKAQGGRCAICRRTPNRVLAVDHSHSTGEVRGLLCTACNIGISYFEDEPEWLRQAAVYLQKGTSTSPI